MEHQDGYSECPGSRGTSISSLLSTMPWEWTLEILLDLQKLSLSYLREFVGFIPQINEPRCSRLLQKVALRFLDEVIVTRKVDACDVPLIRFVLMEQGVSNLHRIHSLKESFENDLILRVETEAVLTNLRCGTKVGTKIWEDFEDTLNSVFPEDSCGTRGVERRKELIAVLPDRLSCGPQKDLRDQLLRKYSLDELLRDIEHFIEDKKKLFKIKFLDQLAIDVDTGVYSLSSTPPCDLHELQISAGVRQAIKGAGNSQVPDVVLSGRERLMHKPKHPFSKVDDSEVLLPGIADEVTDPTLALNQATYLPSSSSAPCKVDQQPETDNNENRDVHKRVRGANAPLHENLRAEMSWRMSEVDEVAKGITNEINELVNDISRFAENMHNAAGIPELIPCLGNQQKPNLGTTTARDPVWMQQNPEVDLVAHRAETDIGPNKATEDHIDTRKRVDNHLPTKHDFVERIGGGDAMERQAIQEICVDKVMKRNANEIVDQFTGVAKKVKYVDAEESEGQKKQTKQCSAKDKIGFQFSPIVTENDGEGQRKERLTTEIENTVAAENGDGTDKTGRTHRTRIYLDRMSKKSQITPPKVDVTSAEVPVAGNGDGDLNAKCCLCGSGGCQAFCHGCPVSVHERCLLKFCMAQASMDNSWYCFNCAAKLAQEGVKKAMENVKKAKEALVKAEEEALKTQKNLAAFSSATEEWSQVHYQLQKGLTEQSGQGHSGSLLQTSKRRPKAMLAERSSTDDSEPEIEGNISSNIEHVIETTVSNPGPTLKKAIDSDSVRLASLNGKEINKKAAPETSTPAEVLDATRSNSVIDSIFSREAANRPASVIASPAPAPSLPVIDSIPSGDEKRFETGGKKQLFGPENLIERQPPLTSGARQSHTRSGMFEGTNEDAVATNVASSGSDVSLSPGGDANLVNDSQLNVGKPGGEEGDGHDGDLEEACEGNKTDTEGGKVAEQTVDEEVSEDASTVPNVEARPRRQQAYRKGERRQIPGIRRRNLPWTDLEEAVLKKGVKKFSNGGQWGFQWKRVLEFGDGTFYDSRTAVDLKDKWRNMMKTGGIL